jgi:thiosulfate dehydrogenase
MKGSWHSWLAATAAAAVSIAGPGRSIAANEIDLSRWVPPDIATVADDRSGALVKYGYRLFTDTANEIGPTMADPTRRFAGNNLVCQNCHLRGGAQPYAMPLMGVAGQFPQYRAREGRVATLEDRIDGCLERSMNGRALPPRSREMQAFISYVRWLSSGIPDGAKLVGAGTLRIKEPARAADLAHGGRIFVQTCASCHGADGQGQRNPGGAAYQFPPLWGPDSFNNGAGMSRLLTAAAYAMHNMPLGITFDMPVLTDEEAYDVAGYLVSRERPDKANLDKDFPVRLQKPIDTPYGPHADGFSLEQHRYGPYGPIRAKVRVLAAASGTTNAGEPDNGSAPSQATK